MIQIREKTSGKQITIKGARQHNLKNIDLVLPRNQMIVFTGVSGSGKSSLVFDTIYAEGQRRYVESLSSYARQFLERINKPDVDSIQGICPAVSIEQKTGSKNSRSTVATTTEIYDYLRLLFARIGKTYCISCGKEVIKASTGTVTAMLEEQEEGSKWLLGFPIHEHSAKPVSSELELLKKRGFFRIWSPEGMLDLNDDFVMPASKKGLFVVLERFKITRGSMRERLADSIELAFKEGENHASLINADTGKVTTFNKFYECCGIKYEEPEPRFFSFNNPFGACPVCQGFGKTDGIDMDLVIPNQELSLRNMAVACWDGKSIGHYYELMAAAGKYKIPVDTPWYQLSDDVRSLIKTGTKDFQGIDSFFDKLEKRAETSFTAKMQLVRFRGYTECRACKGSRLRRETLQVQISRHSIFDIVRMSIEKALEFFKQLSLTDYEKTIGERVQKEIVKRLSYLNDVGLSYLTLDRVSSTLSGGETQRINLATALGSSLVGTLYILDEPSIGLHPRDNEKLINILKNLRNIGNTVLVVEHDPEMMMEADMIVDVGPKAGVHGGEIVAQGKPATLYEEFPDSLTAQYLFKKKMIAVPANRNTEETPVISIKGARENNLKNVSVDVPLKKFVCVTGVSGSGKSTLVHNVLYAGMQRAISRQHGKKGKYESITGQQFIDDVKIVDQSPIGKSPRSIPISYIQAFDLIRELLAATHLAKERKYLPGYFSFNVGGGRCDTCSGEGAIRVEMQFLADIFLPCDDCNGKRYKREILDVTYNGRNIVEILEMTVDEAVKFFEDKKKLSRLLQTLADVGLGYIKLGQPTNTLSGGEAQRIKIASILSTIHLNQANTLFVMDEPTTGLHFDDINKLLRCFELLLAAGHSLVVIEHNLEVIKCADYIIDMGPEAGDRGGTVVATGTPEEIAAIETSITGRYLKAYL